ncbi:MAG: DUF6798 domain-containing protein [Pyrinomonadaceae bacterium]
MPDAIHLPESPGRSSIAFWLCIAFVFLVVVALHGRTVPYGNEFIYLLRLEPGFLQNDWSFSQTASEHWLFNTIFSVPTRFVPVETVAWFGRVAFWIACLAALFKLGRNWPIPVWAIALSISLWLAFGQSVVNAEWIFGTFEAKVVAYACLLMALDGFARCKSVGPGMLLGLAFSFHPAVGLWAIPSVGIAMLVERRCAADLAKIALLTFLFCLPGLIPLIVGHEGAVEASAIDWEFVVKVHMPFHFDPFYFSKLGVGIVCLMGVFNAVAFWRVESFALRFLRNFQIAIGACFLLGFLLRAFEIFPPLRFMPMRLFPILTPLFFLFTVFCVLQHLQRDGRRGMQMVVVLVAIGLIAPLNPLGEGLAHMRETRDSWRTHADDFETSLIWISQHTPPDAVILSTPNHGKLWYLSKRAHVASYRYPRYERLIEWRRRISDLTGGVEITEREQAHSEIANGFDRLSTEQILTIAQKYAGTHLVTRTEYPFPVIFETEQYRIYELR